MYKWVKSSRSKIVCVGGGQADNRYYGQAVCVCVYVFVYI